MTVVFQQVVVNAAANCVAVASNAAANCVCVLHLLFGFSRFSVLVFWLWVLRFGVWALYCVCWDCGFEFEMLYFCFCFGVILSIAGV